MKDLPALNNELTDIAVAADRMTSVIEHVQKLHETLEACDCAHDISILGNGFDADISIRIQLISLAPRVRDLPLPMPKATTDTFSAEAETILDEAIYEAVTGKSLPVEAEAIFDDDDADPVKVHDSWDSVELPGGGAVITRPAQAFVEPDPVSEFGSADAGLAEAEAKPLAKAAGGVDAAPPAAATIATNFDSNRWTSDEEAIIRAGVVKGLTDRQISEMLPHRTIKAIMLRRQRLRDQRRQPAPPPPPPPPPVTLPAEPMPEAPPFGATLSGGEHARLERLGQRRGWTVERDLALVTGLTRGLKLHEVSIDIGIDAVECRTRYAELVPAKTMEQQSAVLKALTERVAAKARRAA